jgi:hypothetical protein
MRQRPYPSPEEGTDSLLFQWWDFRSYSGHSLKPTRVLATKLPTEIKDLSLYLVANT